LRPELETYHLIDSYLNGKLEGETLRAFEEQLKSDPAFAEEVSFQQLTNEVVIGASYDSLRSQMTKDIEQIDTSAKIKTWSLYTVAAFILLTGGISIYRYTHNESKPAKTDVKEFKPAAQSSVSTAPAKTYVNTDLKTPSYQKQETQQTPDFKESAVTKIDTQAAVTQIPNVQQHTPSEKTAPDVKTHQPAENTGTVTTANPCLNTRITAETSSRPACILLSNVQGGTSPYTLSLDHSAAKPVKESYSYLSAGTHTLLITDKNGCSKELHVSIAEKNCRKTSYVFAPEKGETWKISGTNSSDFSITILNIAGTQVYKSNTMQGEFEWQGIGQQGEYLSAGLYIYVIEYKNGQTENGQVTIVR
jgi:hypothetical protein